MVKVIARDRKHLIQLIDKAIEEKWPRMRFEFYRRVAGDGYERVVRFCTRL